MQDKNQNQENPLASGEYANAGAADPFKHCDDDRTKQRTIPVSIQPGRVDVDCSNPQFIEISAISKLIRDTRIDFNSYKKAMDGILNCIHKGDSNEPPTFTRDDLKKQESKTGNEDQNCDENILYKEIAGNNINIFKTGPLYSSSKSYNILKYATERYVYTYFGIQHGDVAPLTVLPYVKLVESNLADICCKCETGFRPLFTELIWNYWMEEGMMVNSINAITNRFQNKSIPNGGLGNLAIDPLRPINNLIWGYIQDSINHLSPMRRIREYDHQYGLGLLANGNLNMRTADNRSSFIQAFHNLLYKCSMFYKEADNLLKVPDAFPVLNALREVHLLLSEGADNQFGDLPVTARVEMLLEQYILSRPEIREFLGGRVMVPYEEGWMDRVDSMRALQGWSGASISYFRDLAVYGEQIILSIRWISWSQFKHRDFAREWAILFREDIQRYIHCYQAVTGVDLSAAEIAGATDVKSMMPAFLMKRKLQRDMSIRR